MNTTLIFRNSLRSLAEDLPDLLAPQWRQSGSSGPPQVHNGPSGGGRPSGGPPQRSAPASKKANVPWGIISGVVLIVLVLGWAAWALSPHPATIPTTYTHFAPGDNVFSCDGPTGWNAKPAIKYDNASDTANDQEIGGIDYTSGSALIDVTQDRTSAITSSDLLNSSGPVPSSMTGTSSLAQELVQRTQVRNVKGYTELTTTPAISPMGAIVVTEWTASGPTLGFPYAIHGYKAAAVAGSFSIAVVCQCPDNQWAQLKPVFDHVLASFKPGTRVINELNAPQPGMH